MAEAMITFEENGFPVELISDRDIRKAVSSGRLRRETVVKVHSPGQQPLSRPADAVERLRPFLGIEEPVAPAAPLVPLTKKAREGSRRAAPAAADGPPPPATPAPQAPAPAATGASVFLDEDTHHSEQDQAYAPPPPMQPQDKPFQPWILPAILVGILGLAALTTGGGTAPQSNSSVAPPPASFDNSLETGVYNTSVAEDETIGDAQTFYAVRDAAVRLGPSRSSAQVGTLRRGDSVYGIRLRPAGGEEIWVRVDSGSHVGAYLWLANMSDVARPTLAEGFSQQWTIGNEVGLYSAPNETSPRLDGLSVGLSVNVIGELQNGWWEIARQSGGVGYVPPWAFEHADGGAAGDNVTDGSSGNVTAPAGPAPDVRPRSPQLIEAPPAEPSSWCIFKNGVEVRIAEDDCRARGGQIQR